jgi:hypothetical protein
MSDPRWEQFEQRYGAKVNGVLGFGRDGTVVYTDRATAVKFFDRADVYQRELTAYELIVSRDIREIVGHRLPQLQLHDDELLAIEITIVKPPYLLDFASAYQEAEAPDFPPEVMSEWWDQKAEEFGDRWPDVQHVMNEFRRLLGMVLLDINPENIKFGDDDTPA